MNKIWEYWKMLANGVEVFVTKGIYKEIPVSWLPEKLKGIPCPHCGRPVRILTGAGGWCSCSEWRAHKKAGVNKTRDLNDKEQVILLAHVSEKMPTRDSAPDKELWDEVSECLFVAMDRLMHGDSYDPRAVWTIPRSDKVVRHVRPYKEEVAV